MSGLYIHIPYCLSKCAYCDFYSVGLSADQGATLVNGLEREWALRCHEIEPPATIYFGGGTPSVLPCDRVGEMARFLPRVQGEFTVEMNPGDVTPAVVTAWQQLGMNRASMGVQSLVDTELQAEGRRHSAQRAIDDYLLMRSMGVDNISLDLIYGLPGQTLDSWQASLDAMMGLRPDHLSAYMLSYEPGTLLTRRRDAGQVSEPSEDTLVEMYGMLCRTARANGYEHYEISNFALPGRRARHNAAYWDGTPYLGLGPGAHSWDGLVRRANPRSVHAWHQALAGGRSAFEVEEETCVDRLNDRLMTALRTSQGLDVSTLDTSARHQLMERVGHLPPGRVIFEGQFLTIPEEQWLVSDDTIARLFW